MPNSYVAHRELSFKVSISNNNPASGDTQRCKGELATLQGEIRDLAERSKGEPEPEDQVLYLGFYWDAAGQGASESDS